MEGRKRSDKRKERHKKGKETKKTNVEYDYQGLGEGVKEWLFNRYSFSFERWKSSGDWLHNVKMLNPTKVYT